MAFDMNTLLAMLFGGMQQAQNPYSMMAMGLPAMGYASMGNLYSPYGNPYTMLNLNALMQQQAAGGAQQQQAPLPYWQRVFNQYNSLTPEQQQNTNWNNWFGGGPQANWTMMNPAQQQQLWSQYGPQSQYWQTQQGKQQTQQNQYWQNVANQYAAMSPQQRQSQNWAQWGGGGPLQQWQQMTPQAQQQTWDQYFGSIL